MSVSLTVRSGTARDFPTTGEEGWGSAATALIQDLVVAVNDSPTLSQSGLFNAIVGDAAEVAAGTATHLTLAAVIADAAITDGMRVLVLPNTYTLAAQLDISKALKIEGFGSTTIFEDSVTIVTGAMILISNPNVSLKNIVIKQSAGTPQYAIEIADTSIDLDVRLKGSFTASDLLFTATDSADVAGYIRKDNATYSLGGSDVLVQSVSLEDVTTPAYQTIIKSNSSVALAANRTLTLDVKNADRTIAIGGDLTTSGAVVLGTHALTFQTGGATSVILPTTGTLASLDGTEVLSNKTLTTPTIADFTNANHDHSDAANGGQITDAALSAAIGVAKGGTGLTSIGTANQVFGVDAAGTGVEYKSIVGTANRVTVTHTANTVTLSAPQDLHTAATPTFGAVNTASVTIDSASLKLSTTTSGDIELNPLSTLVRVQGNIANNSGTKNLLYGSDGNGTNGDNSAGIICNSSGNMGFKNRTGDFVAFSAATAATTALDNLASVAINTTLVSDTNNTDDLGTSSIAWRKAFVGQYHYGVASKAAYTILDDDGISFIKATDSQTLPAPANNVGREIMVYNAHAANNIEILRNNASDTINGLAEDHVLAPGQFIKLLCFAANEIYITGSL